MNLHAHRGGRQEPLLIILAFYTGAQRDQMFSPRLCRQSASDLGPGESETGAHPFFLVSLLDLTFPISLTSASIQSPHPRMKQTQEQLLNLLLCSQISSLKQMAGRSTEITEEV